MNLIRYIENRYQELQFELRGMDPNAQTAQGGYAWKEAHIKALYNVLTHYRWLLRVLIYPTVFFSFWGMKLGLLPQPVPVLINKARADHDAHLAQQEKKVGMSQKKGSDVAEIH